VIWAAHFLASYVTVAIYCEKAATFDQPSLGGARIAVGVYTLVSLIGIAAVGWSGWKHHRYGDQPLPHDDDTPSDRRRFMGFATFLLAVLSFIATIFVALAVVFVGDCH